MPRSIKLDQAVPRIKKSSSVPKPAIRSYSFISRFMQRQIRLGQSREADNAVINPEFVSYLIEQLTHLERQSRPSGGVRSAKGKDLRAREALCYCGWLIQHIAGWALDHQRGLAIARLENVDPQDVETPAYRKAKAAVDNHQHEERGMSKQLGSDSPAIQRKTLHNILRPLAGFIDLPFWTVDGLKALDYGEFVPLFEKTSSDNKRRFREQLLQLKTVQFVEYQHAKGMGLSEARQIAGNVFGVGADTIRTWSYRLRRSLGQAVVEKQINNARLCGKAYLRHLHEPNFNGPGEFGEDHYGKAALVAAGKTYSLLLKGKMI